MTTLDVNIDDILSSLSAGAPSYRALAVTDIVSPPQTPRVLAYGRRRGQTYKPRRNLFLNNGGRGYADLIPSGTVVQIETGLYGYAWRITRSQTGEPTPLLVSHRSKVPNGAVEKLTEAHDLIVYQTPASLLDAALYQHEKGRRTIALAMMNQAIVLKARHSNVETVSKMERSYMRFRKTSSLALSPGTEGEGEAALIAAVKTGTSLIKGE